MWGKVWLAGALTTAALVSVTGAGPAQAVTPVRQPDRLLRADSSWSWLSKVNVARKGSGVPSVTDNTAWTQGIGLHLRYLRLTPAEYFRSYPSAHTENPDSPYYSAEGAAAGGSSNLAFGTGGPAQAIDAWMGAPFHAIGILRPALRQAAFARDGDGDAGLDVIRGLTGDAATKPVLWPGPGASTALTEFGGENPNPLETCGWSTGGLPLVAMLPSAPPAGTGAVLRDADGHKLPVCVVTEKNYRSSDKVYGPTGKAILAGEHAVLVVPKRPLAASVYSVAITRPGQSPVQWTFARTGSRTEPLEAGSTTPVNVANAAGSSVSGRLQVISPAGRGTATVYPCGTTRPRTPTLTFSRDAAVDVTVASGRYGDVCLSVSAGTHVRWTTSTRVFDTRTN